MAVCNFFNQGLEYRLKNKRKLKSWIELVIRTEGAIPGEINFIFTTDEDLLLLNEKFLKRDTLTDVIAFGNDDDGGRISGDIFISLPRVRENSREFHEGFLRELYRVMIHGVLHLIGYKDKTAAGKKEMRTKEELYLNINRIE